MGKSSAPQAPDFSKLALQDTANAKDMADYSANLNRINQTNPYGTSTFTNTPVFDQQGYDTALQAWQAKNQQGTWVPETQGVFTGYDANGMPLYQGASAGHWEGATGDGTPMPTKDQFTRDQWSQETEYSPEQQALYNSNNQLQQGLNNAALSALPNISAMAGKPIDTSGLAGFKVAPSGGDDASRQRVEQAMLSRVQPQIQQDRDTLNSSLMNSGIEKGTDAWNRAWDTEGRKENDLRAAMILAGGQEDSRQFNMGLAQANQQNQTRQQGLAELLGLRSQPLTEFAALRSGNAPAQLQFNPYYTPGVGAGGSQMQGGLAANQAAQQAYATNTAADNGTYAALAALASAAITASDRRLKKNIRTIGKHPVGVRRVRWDWFDGSGSDTGVIAQELMEVRPDAVVRMDNGFYGVNYDLIGGR